MNVLFKMMIMYYYYYYTRLTRVWTLNGKTKKKKEMGILVFPYSLEPNDVKLQNEGACKSKDFFSTNFNYIF